MRRSISLNQIDVVQEQLRKEREEEEALKALPEVLPVDSLLNTCEQYLEDQPRHAMLTKAMSEVRTTAADEDDDLLAESKENSPSYGTLPKVMRKNISRSLVPRMRKMFERARSLDPPDLPQIRIKVHTEPHRSMPPVVGTSSSDRGEQEQSSGTESVSSFVAVSTEDGLDERAEADDNGEEEKSLSVTSDGASASFSPGAQKKGFVNKYVKKVKNIMGSNGKLSQKE